jgi:hypothetical protein
MSDRLYAYRFDDGRYFPNLTIEEADKYDKQEKKEKNVAKTMNDLEQMANSGNYSLEGAMALASKNQVADDPNVQAYIKSMADDMVNKGAREQFGFDQQFSGNMPAQTQQAVSSSGNTLSSWSSGTPDFNPPALSEENQAIADNVELDRNAAPWSSQSNSSGSGNTVASALSGNQQQQSSALQQQVQEPENELFTRLPVKFQQMIKRTGLSDAEYEMPVRKYLASRDFASFSKDIAAAVESKLKLDQALENNDRERAFGLMKDLYGKAPITGPDGSSSFTADDVTKGKVSFGTDRLPAQVSKSESHSYQHYIGAGGKGNTTEGLVKLLADRTAYIQSLRESGLSDDEKTNDIRKYNAFIDQEAKRAGFKLPKVISKDDAKWFLEAKRELDAQEALEPKKRHPGYAAAKRDYENKKADFGWID